MGSKLPDHLDDLRLVTPDLVWEAAYRDMAADFLAAGESPCVGDFLAAGEDFAALVRALQAYDCGEDLRPGLVPWSTYWLRRDDGRLVGESRLRHQLTASLAIEGGHVGYAIRPSERRRGYGTLVLALTLAEARARGLSQVLLTCDSDNLASTRIILKNGGVLAGEGPSPRTGELHSRYWIEL